MQTQIEEICRFMDALAPQSYKESYDNVGVLVGNTKQALKGILVNLDCTPEVVTEAKAKGCNLIITHHPILFSGLKSLTGKNYVERAVMEAIKADIVLYASHTNLDKVAYGVSKIMADKLGLQSSKVLRNGPNLLKSLVVFCPSTHAEAVRNALFAAGAGSIGNYDACSFNTEGIGTFRGNAQSNPKVGAKGIDEKVAETRIEVMLETQQLPSVLSAMQQAHPYEELAYYIYDLGNVHPYVGLGMLGSLSEAMPFIDFLKRVKTTFKCESIRYTKAHKTHIHKVALCGGSGFDLLKDAKHAKADVYLTSDVKYHQFFEAEEDIILVDIGHYESEHHTSEWICKEIIKKFPNFAPQLSTVNTNPINYL